jgi:hypothetical protein
LGEALEPRLLRSAADDFVLLTIFFPQGYCFVDGSTAAAIGSLARLLAQRGAGEIAIYAFASAEGSAAYNLRLAQLRRTMVQALLAQGGFRADNAFGRAVGEIPDPRGASGSALTSARLLNRRATVMADLAPVRTPAMPRSPQPDLLHPQLPWPQPPVGPDPRILWGTLPPPPPGRSVCGFVNDALRDSFFSILRGAGFGRQIARDIAERAASGVGGAVGDAIFDQMPDLDDQTRAALRAAAEAACLTPIR